MRFESRRTSRLHRAIWATKPPPLTSFQGCQNGAFGKRSFCSGDTRHFRHFRRFPGLRSKNPLFLWMECTIRISPIFVKTTCFRQGKKTPFSKTTVSTTLKFGADFFLCFFFFWLPSSEKAECAKRFSCNVRNGFLRRFLVRRFSRRFLRRFLVRRFFFDVLVLEKKQVFQSHAKKSQKISGEICGVHMALFVGVSHSISAFLNTQHVT